MAGKTVIVSYNPVIGFPSGWYGDGRLCVRANDGDRPGAYSGPAEAGPDANAAIALYGICQEELPLDGVAQFIFYAGLHAFDVALLLARKTRELCPDAAVTVVSCGCDWKEKQALLEGTMIPMIRSECGGREKLAAMAREILAEA